MIVSTKGRYALRVMVELAQHQGDGYVPLNVIAERQDISEKYLESILKVLVQDKLLTGLRGPWRRLPPDKSTRRLYAGGNTPAHRRFPGSRSLHR